jgi:hypothetical protein
MPKNMRDEANIILSELKENPDGIDPEKVRRLEILISYKILAFKVEALIMTQQENLGDKNV